MAKYSLPIALFAFLLWDTGTRCLAQSTPPISISNTREFRPQKPSEIKTVEDAMDAVITVTNKDLGLPLVEPLYLHLHKSANDFAAYGGRSGRRLSPEIVSFALAVAQENQFHVNMEKVRGRPWSTLLWTFAHEYAHNIEYAFSSVNRGPQWIREGFADWVAARVIDNLGWQDYSATLQRAKLEVRRQAASLPPLSELETSSRWSIWANGPTGGILTYRLAFLAVNDLIARSGLPAMEKYFVTQSFENQFSVSWNDFEKQFRARLQGTQASAASLGAAEKPEWKTGYRWIYAWKSPGVKGTLIREVEKEDILDGLAIYVVRSGKSTQILSKDSLALIATGAQEKLLTKRTVPHEFFAWPLTIGKEWKTSFVVENVVQKTTTKLTYVKVISTAEELKVPAGVFETFKIDTYVADTGRLVAEQWYAPTTKWFAKIRNYLPDGVREEDLTAIKID